MRMGVVDCPKSNPEKTQKSGQKNAPVFDTGLAGPVPMALQVSDGGTRLPGGLRQPEFILPLQRGSLWRAL
jgi:hypothetical protein